MIWCRHDTLSAYAWSYYLDIGCCWSAWPHCSYHYRVDIVYRTKPVKLYQTSKHILPRPCSIPAVRLVLPSFHYAPPLQLAIFIPNKIIITSLCLYLALYFLAALYKYLPTCINAILLGLWFVCMYTKAHICIESFETYLYRKF